MKKILLLTYLGFIFLASCKKDKQPSAQYYGEPISESREFFPDQELFDFTTSPAVSPDGRYLIYIVPSTVSIARKGLWLINLQTGDKKLLKKDATYSSPSWSPDSRHFCYIFNGNLMISDINGDDTEQLTFDRSCLRPNWHPTKKKIVFDGNISGTYTIDVVDIETADITQSISATDIGGSAGWISNTDSILTSQSNYGYRILNLTTGQVLLSVNWLTLIKKNVFALPSISRDGKKIAFQAANGIYIINTDGTNLQQVLYNSVTRKPGTPYKSGDKLVNDISWHPDGKHLIYQIIEFTTSSIGFGNVYGEGYSTLYKLDIEKALQINKP
ncbi:PD40 domain-containing protein [Pedobacter sp. SD-b]|uniref:PD40 domain-containing protein n=1 Tax=Pedobacter segetis TaxID=2793069 RepID=A0ABS1BM17_9SPHI|nr:DPP IV N-terminal domain-containing protein [Pedobacter segetis]MBK0383939.1 PD40 domain-containing protein [Pedobacter segetis]